MFKLLNRFAWFISLSMWFIITYIFISGNWNYYSYSSDIIQSAFFWFIFWIIFKGVFLSQHFIEERVTFFADALKDKILSKSSSLIGKEVVSQKTEEKDTIIKDKIIAEKVKTEVVTEKVSEEDCEYMVRMKEVKNDEEINNKKLLSEENQEKKEEYTPSQVDLFFSRLSSGISKFFSENLLAKIGWILVFLSVLFFLSLIYSNVWNVAKIIIGFAVWFGVYIVWVILEKKWLEWEWKILLWVWILINYLVILSWRYLLGDSWYLSEWTTMLFLVLNTIFAIVTSLVYKSQTLLIFSFVFAYLNPMLIGSSSDSPYTLVSYSMIVSIWALFLWIKQKNIILIIGSFLLWNILFLLAPYISDIWCITKVVASMILWFASICSVYNINKWKEFIWWLLIVNYIILVFHLMWNSLLSGSSISYIVYMIYLLWFFAFWVFYLIKWLISSVLYIFILPIFIVFWLVVSGDIFSIPLTLGLITIVFLIWFSFMQAVMWQAMKYIYLSILWLFIVSSNVLSVFDAWLLLNFINYITTIIISFVFIFTSYFLSKKEGLWDLYSLWTLLGILILAPLIIINQDNTNYVTISIISMVIFSISNIILPFINKNLKDVKNILIWSVLWILFIWAQLYRFWNEYFPWVTLGFVFLAVAILYFILWIFMSKKLDVTSIESTNSEDRNSSKDIVMSYLWISISIFSFAIALVFSNNPEIISLTWLFEATILFYFHIKSKSQKLFIWAIILFLIGVINLFNLSSWVNEGDFMFLVPFALMLASFILNIKFLDSIKSGFNRVSHDILHILWIGTLWSLLAIIIPHTWFGWNIFWISIFILFIWSIYAYFSSNILKIYFIIIFALFWLNQITSLWNIINTLEYNDSKYLIVLQYLSTIFLWISVTIWNKINKSKFLNIFINVIFAIYILFILSDYVYYIFSTTFAVTIFWWIVSFILLNYGIWKNLIKFRTIWLYLVSLVSAKIFLYDVWFAISDNIVRVVAFMVIWIMFIIISTKYSKRYGNNLAWEFSLWNFKGTGTQTIPESDPKKESKNYKINQSIKDINVDDIQSVKLSFSSWKVTRIRSLNLLKIVKMALDNFWKNDFEKWELKDIYDFVQDNYKSELNKRDYDKILSIFSDFVKEWGSVELVKK